MDNNKNKKYWDKRLIIVIEVFLCFIFGMMFVWGAFNNNSLIEGIFSNAFTALLVTFIATLVGFNTETDAEKAVRESEEHNANLINLIDNLNGTINNLSTTLDHIKAKECSFCANQISDIKPSRAECNLSQLFDAATSEISIYTINLRTFVPYISNLQNATKRGVNVRIAAMHPSFAKKFNALRHIEGDPPDRRWKDMKAALVQFLSAQQFLHSNNFSVCAYSNAAPTLVLIVVDNICCVSYLLNEKHSSETIHFVFKNTAVSPSSISPYICFKNHFNSIWNDDNCNTEIVERIESLNYNDIQ